MKEWRGEWWEQRNTYVTIFEIRNGCAENIENPRTM
jgi:hypothetical protein